MLLGYVSIFLALNRLVLPVALVISSLYLGVIVILATIAQVGAWQAFGIALASGLGAFFSAEIGLALLFLAIVMIGDAVRWVVDSAPPPLRLDLTADDDEGQVIGFARYLRRFVAYYVTANYHDDLDLEDPSTRATWPRHTLLISTMLAGTYALFVALGAVQLRLLALVQAGSASALAAFASGLSTWFDGILTSIAGSFFILALAFVLFTLVGVVVVPQRRVAERQLAILTYLLLGTFWFAVVYQAGSVSGALHFAVRQLAGESITPLTYFDALYFAAGTIVTAGGGGITPADTFTRAVAILQFGLLGLVVYWLFQRERA
jgi:hypothetical protein